MGAKITVLTAQKKSFDAPLDLNLQNIEGVNVIEVNYKGASILADKIIFKPGNNNSFFNLLKKIKQIIQKKIGANIDIRSNWAQSTLNQHKELAFNFDIIISTFGPPACHIIASNFKTLNPNLFWVADYRDLWSTSHLLDLPLYSRRKLIRKELSIIKHKANILTTVSDELSHILKNMFQINVAVISNGFDVATKDVIHNHNNRIFPLVNNKIRILYTGMIYEYRRDPRLLFYVINEIILENPSFVDRYDIVFLGASSSVVENMIKEVKNNSFIKCGGHVNRSKVLIEQRNSDFLLLLESGEDDAKGVLTGKIFEYIAMGKPIISLGSKTDSAIGRLLNETGCGFCYENNAKDLKLDLYNAVNGIMPHWYKPNLHNILKYSRENQANILYKIINENF